MNKSLAERAQAHSTYFQRVRDVREKHSSAVSKQFYAIQHDRFKTEELNPHHYIPFPTRRSQQIAQQTAYNQEVSILAGIAKYVGFPAAPTLQGASQSEIEEDLEKMGVSYLYWHDIPTIQTLTKHHRSPRRQNPLIHMVWAYRGVPCPRCIRACPAQPLKKPSLSRHHGRIRNIPSTSNNHSRDSRGDCPNTPVPLPSQLRRLRSESSISMLPMGPHPPSPRTPQQQTLPMERSRSSEVTDSPSILITMQPTGSLDFVH